MYSDCPENIENLLCNLAFIEAAISRGLLNFVLEDIDTAFDKLGFTNIKPVKDSIYNGLAAIRQRPDNSIYTIVNRLIHAENNIISQAFLSSTIELLNKRGVWIRSRNKFPDIQHIKGIITVNSKRKSFYILKNDNRIEEYEIKTQDLKNVTNINENKTIFEISINPETGRIATLTSEGTLFIDSDQTQFKLKPLFSCFSWFGTGIIGVNKNSFLVFLDLVKNIESIIWDSPISTFSSLSISADANSGVFISGDRIPGQQILLVKMKDGNPFCSELVGIETVVKLACLDQKGMFMILSTRSRELILFNIVTKESKIVSCRIAGGFPVRGSVYKCILVKLKDTHFSFFATNAGELLSWDTTLETITRRGIYKGVRQQSTINALEFIPEEDKFILATSESLELLPVSGDEINLSKDPVTKCCLSDDGWMIMINEYGKKVTWYKDDKYVTDFIINNYQPISISSSGEQGRVVVGYSNGMIVKLNPDTRPAFDDAIDLFDSPVIGVVALDTSRVLAASEKGEFRIIKFITDPVEKGIKPIGVIRKEQFIRHLGYGNDFVACGQYHSGESLWSVVVVRSDNSREVVLETKKMVTDLTTDESGNRIYIAYGGIVSFYEYQGRRWELIQTRDANVGLITFCQKDYLAIISQDKGINWLELWDTADHLQTVAALEVPFQVSCTCSNMNLIGVGTIDGNHFVVEIQNKNST